MSIRGPFRFVHVLEDIQSLNQRSERGELEITALSLHQYPFVAKHYALTSCGSSMGDGYGPMLVASKPHEIGEFLHHRVKGGKSPLRIAIPGRRTSAFLALRLLLLEHGAPAGPADPVTVEVVPFDQIIERVADGQFDAGLIIHEGQLTYRSSGLTCLVDLGKWWKESRGLPLPLGGNAIRRDLGPQTMRQICSVLLASIRYALDHREEAVRYALTFGRGLQTKQADQFVGMYVNQWTLDYGPAGRQAVQQFLTEAAAAGLTPPCGQIDFVDPE